MGLTRPRAYQIFDIDYKQSVRVVTISNVTLGGGAPSQVDGVSLSLNDRVLVTGQSTGSQNGLYYVTTVGTGSNGTWQRSIDGNETGEIDAGMVVMVTEGLVYADTQWKLITDDPITIGVTALTFTQNYSANSISSGTSNVSVYSNANVTISAAGTPNVVAVTSTGANVAGYVTATGNVTGNYILGNGALLTGVITSVANINSGTSNVTVVAPNGDITVGVGGTGNIGVFSTTGLAITGDLSVTGNATLSGNILGDRIQNGNTQIDIQTQNGNANITVGGVANVAVFSTSGQNVTGYLTASGNITGGNLVTAGLITGNGAGLTNLTGANVTGTVANATYATSAGSAATSTSATTAGTVTTASQPNITSVGTLSSLSVTGNVDGGNLTTLGQVSASGNISGNYFIGNGSQLTGIQADTVGGNITILTRATGNVNFAVTAGYVTILTRSGNVAFALTA